MGLFVELGEVHFLAETWRFEEIQDATHQRKVVDEHQDRFVGGLQGVDRDNLHQAEHTLCLAQLLFLRIFFRFSNFKKLFCDEFDNYVFSFFLVCASLKLAF